MRRYDPSGIEPKWEADWERDGLFRAVEEDDGRPRFYKLHMFPYPSGDLHVGHAEAFAISDIVARFRWMQGDNVLHPIGWDAFGLPAENAAIQRGLHPKEWTDSNIAQQARTLSRYGMAFDWSRRLSTADPEYYKWTQWLFLQLFKAGLAYRKRAAVNWCPKDKTVLANEQVIDGRCERCDTPVEQRFLDQWFFRITNYAERLLENLQNLDWSSSTVLLQRNWIGRSDGAELMFETPSGKKITVFTTRPDTVFGATYLVLAPEHPFVAELTAVEQRSAVKAYQRDVQSKDIVSRRVGEKTKAGVFIDS